MFFGKNSHSLDEKGRLSIPARYRKEITGPLFLCVDISGEYLEVHNQTSHLAKQQFLASFNPLDIEAQNLKIFLNSSIQEITLDAAGRINLPKDILEIVGIIKDVIVIGNGNSLVIWDAKAFNNKMELNDENIISFMKEQAKRLSDLANENK